MRVGRRVLPALVLALTAAAVPLLWPAVGRPRLPTAAVATAVLVPKPGTHLWWNEVWGRERGFWRRAVRG